MKKIITIGLVSSLLFGCATPYQKVGLIGGFDEFKTSSDSYIVNFKGNGFTGRDRAFKYALRRCAELTQEKKYKYFTIIDSNSSANLSSYRTPVTANTTSNYNSYNYGRYNNGMYSSNGYIDGSSQTTISGGQEVTVEHPSTRISIKMHNNKTVSSLEAQAILENFQTK